MRLDVNRRNQAESSIKLLWLLSLGVKRASDLPNREFLVTFRIRLLSLKQVDVNNDVFWQLLETQHARARNYCIRLTGTIDEGDDLYQDAVLKAHDGFADLRNQESFRPWLYSIINNTYRNRVRHPWWKRILVGAGELEQLAGVSDPAPVYHAQRRLATALSALSADDRMLVIMSEVEGWKISELAKLFNKSEGFVKMRLSRARKKMRDRLASLVPNATSVGNEGLDLL